MKWKLLVFAVIAAAATTIAGQSQNAIPKDDGYVSTYRPTPSGGGPDTPTKDDALARLEDMRERMGGDLSPEFMQALMAGADAQRAQYGPAGRGSIKVPAGGPGRISVPTGRIGFRTAIASMNPIPAVCGRSSSIRAATTSSTC